MVLISSNEFELRKKAEIDAIEHLRNSFFIGFLTSIFAMFMVALIEFAIIGTMALNGVSEYEDPVIWLITISTVESVYVFFLFFYLYTLDNARKLVIHFVKEFAIVRIGAVILAAASAINMVLIVFIGTSGIAIFSNIYLLLLGTFGSVIMFIGNILIALGTFKLGKHYRNSEIKMGAIIMIFFGFIGMILLYSSLGKIIRDIEKRLPPPPMPPWINS